MHAEEVGTMAKVKVNEMTIIETGGHCRARMLEFSNLSYILVTDLEGLNEPKSGDAVLIGFYTKGGECLGTMETDTLTVDKL